MSRHSKNNTSRPIFTYQERQKLTYGTQKQRLGHDSMKEYDCCALCLHKLREPLCCKKGHVFCKECIYEFLLAQKKEVARQTELYEEQEKRIKEKQEQEEILRKQKEYEMFDKTVCGFTPGPKTAAPKEETHVPTGHVPIKTPMGTYYYPDASALASEKKQAQLEASVGKEPKPADKTLPFWIPGTLKEAAPTVLKKPSTDIKCPEGDHIVRLKQLIKLNFSENKKDDKSNKDSMYQCAVCYKPLTNAVKTVALKQCGHVMCTACFTQIKKDGVCCVCSEKFKDDHVIHLGYGTSYAGSSGEKGVAKTVTPTAWL